MESGLTTPHVLVAEIGAAATGRARRVIAVADSSKLGRQGFLPIIPLAGVDVLITDDGADPARRRDPGRRGGGPPGMSGAVARAQRAASRPSRSRTRRFASRSCRSSAGTSRSWSTSSRARPVAQPREPPGRRPTARGSTTGGPAAGTRSSRAATGRLHGEPLPYMGELWCVPWMVAPGRDRIRLDHGRVQATSRRPASSAARAPGREPALRVHYRIRTSTSGRCRSRGGSTRRSRSGRGTVSTIPGERCSSASRRTRAWAWREALPLAGSPDLVLPGGIRHAPAFARARTRFRRPLGDGPPGRRLALRRPPPGAAWGSAFDRDLPPRLALAGVRRVARPPSRGARAMDQPPDGARGSA